jgi:hypothetical protein
MQRIQPIADSRDLLLPPAPQPPTLIRWDKLVFHRPLPVRQRASFVSALKIRMDGR